VSRREAFFVKQLYDTRDISAKDAVGILNALKEKGEISNQDLRKLGFDAKDEAGDRITLMYKLAQFETSIKEIEHLESEQRSNDLIFVFALLQGSSSTKSVTINGRKFTEKDVKALSSSVKGTRSTNVDISKLNSKSLYRVMSEAELKAVQETGYLRGGRKGTTYFTDSYYKNASNARNRLSLPNKPEYIVEFKITNNPVVMGGNTVKPDYGGLGGGREYFSNDLIKVEIINYQK